MRNLPDDEVVRMYMEQTTGWIRNPGNIKKRMRVLRGLGLPHPGGQLDKETQRDVLMAMELERAKTALRREIEMAKREAAWARELRLSNDEIDKFLEK